MTRSGFATIIAAMFVVSIALASAAAAAGGGGGHGGAHGAHSASVHGCKHRVWCLAGPVGRLAFHL
jgi:hypothetical protein